MIKPMAKTNNIVHVEPDEFRNYFELLFTFINDNTPDHSGYICEVEVLDFPFTLYEVERSIKHLKVGKAAGHDNIKSDYILIEQGNRKFVILTLFNKLYELGYFSKEWSTGVIVPTYMCSILTKGSTCRKNKKLRFFLILIEQVMTNLLNKKLAF